MRNATWGKASESGIHTGEIFNIMLGALDLRQTIRLQKIIRNTTWQNWSWAGISIKNQKANMRKSEFLML